MAAVAGGGAGRRRGGLRVPPDAEPRDGQRAERAEDRHREPRQHVRVQAGVRREPAQPGDERRAGEGADGPDGQDPPDGATALAGRVEIHRDGPPQQRGAVAEAERDRGDEDGARRVRRARGGRGDARGPVGQVAGDQAGPAADPAHEPAGEERARAARQDEHGEQAAPEALVTRELVEGERADRDRDAGDGERRRLGQAQHADRVPRALGARASIVHAATLWRAPVPAIRRPAVPRGAGCRIRGP